MLSSQDSYGAKHTITLKQIRFFFYGQVNCCIVLLTYFVVC